MTHQRSAPAEGRGRTAGWRRGRGSSKKKAAEVWDALKTRFVGADRVKAARLSTLRGEFDRLDMADGEKLDVFAGKISGMAARYTGLGAILGASWRWCWRHCWRYHRRYCRQRRRYYSCTEKNSKTLKLNNFC